MNLRHQRLGAAIVLCGVLAVGAWLASEVLRPEVLPVGADLPPIRYRNGSGVEAVLAGRGRPMLVLLFHSECSHCHDQMDDLSDHLDALGGADLFFLTTEDTLPMREMSRRWPRLATAGNVTWGTVSGEDFRRDFGSRATPGIYLFGSAGVLRQKNIGTVQTSTLREQLSQTS
jgi:hypothetical protein